MTTLSNKIKNNIEFLLKLKEEDNVHANKCSLIDQTEYVQINNDLEIEYAIYITLTELLGEERILINVDYKYDDIINIIDKCITNIYDNKQLNLLIEKSDTFNSMINHIEDLFDNMKDKVFYYSPLYNLMKIIDGIKRNIIYIFKENNKFIDRLISSSINLNDHMMYGTNISLNNDLDEENNTSDEDEDEDEDGNEDEGGEDGNEDEDGDEDNEGDDVGDEDDEGGNEDEDNEDDEGDEGDEDAADAFARVEKAEKKLEEMKEQEQQVDEAINTISSLRVFLKKLN